MAQRTIIVYLDDIDGEEFISGETVTFAVDGIAYEIDLRDTHAQELRSALAPYVKAGRPTRWTPRATRKSTATKAKV